MKTKKFISMLSLALGLLVSVFAFTACGSDDEENNDSSTNTLFGTWRAEVEEKGEIQYWEFTINSDYTFTSREYNKSDGKVHATDSGTFQLQGNNTVKISSSDGEVVTTRYKITDGNKLEFLDADHGIVYYKIK